MVAKKHKSKRQKASHKYKVIRKVAEHHRKIRKENKDKPHKKRKDPGMPTNLPFKDEVLANAMAMKNQVLEDRQRRREMMNQQPSEFTQTMAEPETLPRSYKLCKEIVEEADIIFEMIDSRDPMASRALEIERMGQSLKKQVVLVLTKADAVPSLALQKWHSLLSQEFLTVPFSFKENTQSCLESISILVEKIQKKMKKDVTVGIVGFPNTGKNAFLSALATTEVELIPHVGIIFSKTAKEEESCQVLLRNYSKGTKVSGPIRAAEAIVKRFSTNQLTEKYKIPAYMNTQDLLIHVAKVKQLIRRSGVDTLNAAKYLLQDWYDGRLNHYTEPSMDTESIINDKKQVPKVKELLGLFNNTEGVLIKDGSAVPVDMDMDVLPKGYATLTEADFASDEEMDQDFEEGDDEGDDWEEMSEDEEVGDIDQVEVEAPKAKPKSKKKGKPVFSDEPFEFE